MRMSRNAGLATTEATLALPVLAVLIGGAIHLFGLLRARLEVQRDARRGAWVMRDQAHCGRGRETQALARSPDWPAPVASFVPGGLNEVFEYGRASVERVRVAHLPPMMPRDSGARRLRARARVTCNEPERKGLLDALGGILARVAGL